MGATVIVAVKIMPDSPAADVDKIQATAKAWAEKEGGRSVTFEVQNVAFGLKAVILKMAFPEEKGTDIIESSLSSIEHVSSVAIEDYRRAFG